MKFSKWFNTSLAGLLAMHAFLTALPAIADEKFLVPSQLYGFANLVEEYSVDSRIQPPGAIAQGPFGTCFGASAHYLLQYHHNSTKVAQGGYEEIAFEDVLGTGCNGSFKEFRDDHVQILYNFKKLEKVAVRPYPADYTAIYQNRAALEGAGCLDTLLKKIVDPAYASEVNDIFSQIQDKFPPKELAFNIIDRLSTVRKVALHPFNLYVFDTLDFDKTKQKIQTHFKENNPVPLQLEFCVQKADNGLCAEVHSTTITALRKICDTTGCHDEVFLRDSSQRPGWYQLDPLIKGSINSRHLMTYIQPCSGPGQQPCSEYPIGSDPFAYLILVGDNDAAERYLAETREDHKAQVVNHVGRRSPLLNAFSRGSFRSIGFLLENGADIDVDIEDVPGGTCLAQAAQAGDEGLVKLALSHTADVRLATPSDRNQEQDDVQRPAPKRPRKARAAQHKSKRPRTGAETEAMVNHRDNLGRAALWLAAQEGHLGVSRMLVFEFFADVNMEGFIGTTPLHIASHNGHLDEVELLLASGADIEKPSPSGENPLYSAAAKGHTEVVRVLLAYKANVNHRGPQGATPLWIAVMNGHLDIANLLVDALADVNLAGPAGQTALYVAAQYGRQDLVRFLLSRHADVDRAAANGTNPLLVAVKKDHAEIVRDLLELGKANVDHRGYQGATALMWAVIEGKLEIAKILIAGRADINAVGPNGETPIYLAAQFGHLKLLNLLLFVYADIDQSVGKGVDPLNVAHFFGQFDVVRKWLIHKEAVYRRGFLDNSKDAI